MNVEFDVQLKESDLFRFNMRQIYMTRLQGPISIVIAILFIISGVVCVQHSNYPYAALYFVVAVMFAFYIPVTLKGRSKKTFAKNEVLSGVIHYNFTETAIVVTAGEEQGELPWDCVFKMVTTGKQILIFSNRVNAYILPLEQVGEHYEDVKKIATAAVPKYRIKMK